MRLMINNAPILVMVYDRLESLQKCIETLQKCEESVHSTLYVSSDQAYKTDDILKVIAVREYIKTIDGFKEVIPIFHNENKGLNGAYQFATDLIFEKYERIVFLEDDIIVAPNFLKFMNEGLEFYKNDSKVISISGFSHSVFFEIEAVFKSKIYFTNRWCPWGFATWKNKIENIPNLTVSILKSDLKDKNFVKKLNDIGIDLFTIFKRKLFKNEALQLDYKLVHYMIKNDLYTVTPYTSKTFNIGNDGNGSRTKKSKKYMKFDNKQLENAIPFQFSAFSFDKVDNNFNFVVNNTKLNQFKKILNKIGLLQLGYSINETKKKWKRSIKK